MEVEDYRQKEKPEDAPDDYKPEWETVVEEKTINSMVPLWQRPRSKVEQEEYDSFYREKFGDWQPPLATVTTSSEGTVTFKALLFIPSATPYDFYTREYEKGLQLYSSGVLIMDKCADLLPDHFRFVKGVVDSADFSLNISREVLQHTRQLKTIAAALEKKIKNELVKLMKDDREKYEKFWAAFGRQLKYSVTEGYGAKKELLQDLLLFYSSTEKKLVTLAEYVDRMPESQKYIYYASGENAAAMDNLPQTELLRERNMEILYLTDQPDQLLMEILREYKDKPLRSAVDGDLDLEDMPEEKGADAYKEALDFIKEALGEEVDEVRVSRKLKTHPVCLTCGEGVSFEMERYFAAAQPEMGFKAQRILELNVEHPAFAALEEADASLGPTEDGGYYLVGLKKPCRALFAGQAYGHESVYENALAAIRGAGLRFRPAPPCRDVDVPEDLCRLPGTVRPDSHTARLLKILEWEGRNDG